MKEKTVAVLGLARSGTALSRALAARGIAVRAADRKPEAQIAEAAELRRLGVELFLGGDGIEALAGAELLALSPGVPSAAPAVVEARRRGLPVLSEIELSWRLLEEEREGTRRYVAITGTNGKSTVTAWTADILSRAGRDVALSGNIGTPLASFCGRGGARDFVIELSSFQLETIDRFRADVAVVTNLTPDHLDRHGTLAAYGDAKARIFENQAGEDCGITNADDPLSARFHPPARRIAFSTRGRVPGGVYVAGGAIVSEVSGAPVPVIELGRISLPGLHNLENALAAAAAAECAGAPPASVREGLSRFAGLPHRVRTVAEIGGVAWVNDSKGTNPDAVIKGLAGFPDRSVLLILGGSEKGSDFAPLREAAGRAARVVLTIGQSAPRIESALSGLDVRRAGDLPRAVAMAAAQARPGDTVLLSPACASFDQYRNFEERGEHFERLVRKLAEEVRRGA